jgi:hypothetical protein
VSKFRVERVIFKALDTALEAPNRYVFIECDDLNGREIVAESLWKFGKLIRGTVRFGGFTLVRLELPNGSIIEVVHWKNSEERARRVAEKPEGATFVIVDPTK